MKISKWIDYLTNMCWSCQHTMVSKKCYDSKLPQVLQKPCGSFRSQKKRSFKNKTGGFLSQLMMERESMGEKMLWGTTTRIQKLSIGTLQQWYPKRNSQYSSLLFFSSSGFDGFIICRSVKKNSTQVMMMILSQPCWLSNIYGLTYKLECALHLHQLHTYLANYPST
jgi:hypothetical protein